MGLNSADTGKDIKKTVSRLSTRKDAPIAGFILLLIIYVVTSVYVIRTARSEDMLFLFGTMMPVRALTGVFSGIANICIIFLVVFYKKVGFYVALAIILFQFPVLLVGMIAEHNMSNISGLFTNLLTVAAIIIIYVNNQQLQKYQMRIREQAVTDRLTGLPNRFACRDFAEGLVKENKRFAIVSYNLDNFKSINNTMGHSTGNEILKEVAERFRNSAEDGGSGTFDIVFYMGSDEFTIIVRDFADNEDIERSINYYESALEKKITLDGCDFFTSASIGYAVFPDDATDYDTVLSYADTAMYESKRLGVEMHVCRFKPALLNIERELEVERKIRAALENDGLFFHLQPQFDITHRLRGFETLARMKDDNGEMISPAEFIPVAEKAGLIDQVDSTVFRKAADFFGQLVRETNTNITLSVNISVRHLMKNDFLDEVRDIIESSGVPADQIEVEITESVMIDSVDKALECIGELKKMGIKIAIDDFGTGYSSLSYLNNFPADLLKVDKSFIDQMNTSSSSKKYVAAIISIGHVMNFDVISEGVEDPEQLETLRSIGCDYIQGYIWGRPMEAEYAAELVDKTAG